MLLLYYYYYYYCCLSAMNPRWMVTQHLNKMRKKHQMALGCVCIDCPLFVDVLMLLLLHHSSTAQHITARGRHYKNKRKVVQWRGQSNRVESHCCNDNDDKDQVNDQWPADEQREFINLVNQSIHPSINRQQHHQTMMMMTLMVGGE